MIDLSGINLPYLRVPIRTPKKNSCTIPPLHAIVGFVESLARSSNLRQFYAVLCLIFPHDDGTIYLRAKMYLA